METLESIFYPLIYILRLILELGYYLSGNYGVAIILLSMLVAIITYPLTTYAQKIEIKDKLLQDAMAPDLKRVKSDFKGEEQFNAIEKIYKEHGYHPIKSLKSISGLAFQLPFLLSCLVLLFSYPGLVGEKFLFVNDLSQQDSVFFINEITINILPLIMICVTFYETKIKPEMTSPARIKFYAITVVIFFLIYPLPAAIVLYWTSSNVISLLRTMWRVKSLAH